MNRTTNRTRHVKAPQEWLVWKASRNGSVWYWAGDETWVERRIDAKAFGSVAEAQTHADGAHVSRK